MSLTVLTSRPMAGNPSALTPFVTEWQPANNSTDMHLLSNPYREINMQMISTRILGTAPEAATSVESCGTKADIAAQDGVASAMEPTQLRKVAPLKKEAVRVARLAVSKGFQTVALRAGLRFHCCPCRTKCGTTPGTSSPHERSEQAGCNSLCLSRTGCCGNTRQAIVL